MGGVKHHQPHTVQDILRHTLRHFVGNPTVRTMRPPEQNSAWGIGAVLLVLVLLIDLAARLAKTKLKQKQ